MLNFRNTIISALIVLALLTIADLFTTVSIWIYIGIVLAVIILLVWGSISIRTGFYMKSVCHGNRTGNSVTLTFDDGPDGSITPVILDILKAHNVKATFFVIGSKAEKHPELMQRIGREGHIIGGHSYTHHFFFDLFSYRAMSQELLRTSAVIHRITGKKIRLFRPPYGVTNPTLSRVIRDTQCISIGWSLKSKDTIMRDEQKMSDRLARKLRAGDILLFHDNRPGAARVLGTLISFIKEKQFTVEPLDTFLQIEAYEN